jgi:hypothetical protein
MIPTTPPQVDRRQGIVRWTVVWIAGAAALAIGVSTLFVGPLFPVLGKGGYAPLGELLGRLPMALMVGGIVAVAVGVAGAWRSHPRAPVEGALRSRFADTAAPVGLVVAVVAILTVVIVYVTPSIVQQATGGAGPCGLSPTVGCFEAHPDYYEPSSPGLDNWTTPASRVSQTLGPFFLAAWPLALAGALISLFALTLRTARRRVAIAGLTVGTFVVVGMVLIELGLMLGLGGGD